MIHQNRSPRKDYSSTVVNDSLLKVVKGTGIVFLGTIIGMFFAFLQRIIIANVYSLAEYGIFSLMLGILSILVLIFTLGFKQGVTRQIAFYRGKKDIKKVEGMTYSSLIIAIFSGIILSLILFFMSDIISIRIFSEPRLSSVLRIISFSIPFFILIEIFVSIFRGWENVKPKVIFQNMLRDGLFLLLLVPLVFIEMPFNIVIWFFSGSIILTGILFTLYSIHKKILSFKEKKSHVFFSDSKELLLFSLPLLMVASMSMIINWTDTLMLGYFKTPEVVGLYNGALPLAHLLPIVLTSAGILYVPVASKLYSKDLTNEMGKTYQILTKWIFSFSLPVFFILILFPEITLSFVFGAEYVQSATVLRVLSIGLMLHVFLGLNGLSLMIMGKTRFLMVVNIFAGVINIALNLSLIPLFGIIGAAVASLSSYWVANIVKSSRLFQLTRIHPFIKNNIKPAIIGLSLLGTMYFLTRFFIIKVWMLPIFLIIFLVLYLFLLLLFKCFDKEDMYMINTFEQKIGLNLKPIKKILRKF